VAGTAFIKQGSGKKKLPLQKTMWAFVLVKSNLTIKKLSNGALGSEEGPPIQ